MRSPPWSRTPFAGQDLCDRNSRGHHRPGFSRGVAEVEGDHAHATLNVAPHAGDPAQPARGVVIADRGGARIERAGLGANDPLAKIRILQPLVFKVTRHELRHRPVEQHLAGFLVVRPAERRSPPAKARRRSTKSPIAGRPQRIAQPPDHRSHRFPALHVSWRKAPDLFFARVIIIPELHAGSIEKGNKEAVRSGRPMKAAVNQVQLIDHQRMEKSGEVRARRHRTPGKGSSMVQAPPTRDRLSSTSTRLPARAR